MVEYRKDYEFLPFKTKFLGDKAVIFTYFGPWLALDKESYDKVRFGKIDDALYSILEEKCIIKTPKNSEGIETFVRDYNWNKGMGPTLHIFVPTLRCNQTCRYCYAYRVTEEQSGYDMTEETAKAAVDFMFKTPSSTYSVEFTGGEPLLKFDIIRFIIEYSGRLAAENDKKIIYSVVTNGTLITDEMIDFFKDKKVGLCFSLDGPKEIHNGNRVFTKNPSSDNYSAVLNVLDRLRDEKYPSMNALPVITRDSLPIWKEIVDEYIARGFKLLRFKYVSNFGFASGNWNNVGYSAEEYVAAWKKVIDYLVELNHKGITITEQLATIMIKKILGRNPGYCELDMPCGAVIGQILYNYDGKIYTCDEGRTMEEFSIGDVRTSSYADVLGNPVTKTMVSISSNQSFGCTDCSYFAYCGTCPIENYKSSGTFMVNYPSSYRCKIHKAMFDYIFDKMVNDERYNYAFQKWIHISENGFNSVSFDNDKDGWIGNRFED